nr:putative glycosyltransferase [Vibrio mimicus]
MSPCYGAPELLTELAGRLCSVMSKLTDSFEIIFVNDGCPKNSWAVIQQIAQNNVNVIGINLSRNFGQHRAIAAGLANATGDYIVVMDCDLQDLPEEIPKLLSKALEGYDVVFGRRVKRKDSFWKKLSAKIYYNIFDFLTGFKSDNSIANFSIISKKVVESYNNMPEQNRPYGYFINWLGFNRCNVDIEHAARPEGRSSYNFSKLLGFAINNVISETNKPLRIGVKLGFLMSLSSFFVAMILIFNWYFGAVVQGWTSIVVSIFFVSGLILAKLGLIGLYLGKVFDETKSRPIFVISETINKRD